jgi:hypothetical protein
MCRWHATYCWKVHDKSYNFAWDLTLIGGLHSKLWAAKVAWVSILGISRLPLENPGTKWYLGVGPMAKHREYYKGKVMASPKSGLWWVLRVCVCLVSPKSKLWWVLWVWVCSWLVLAPKVLQLCTNQLVFGFVQVCVSSWCFFFFLIPSWSSNTPFYPQSVANQRACLNSLLFRCFHFIFMFESIKELGNVSQNLFYCQL